MSEETIQSQVREVLTNLRPDIDLDAEDDLVASGLLDSVTIIELTAQLEDECDVEFSPLDMIPENFASLESIAALVASRLED